LSDAPPVEQASAEQTAGTEKQSENQTLQLAETLFTDTPTEKPVITIENQNEIPGNNLAEKLYTENSTGTNVQTSYDDIEKIMRNKQSSQVAAYQALFNAWGHHYNNKIATTACKQAEVFSLRCLHKQGNLNSLRAHNRPAVLALINEQGETRYITITSIQNNLATVYSNNKRIHH